MIQEIRQRMAEVQLVADGCKTEKIKAHFKGRREALTQAFQTADRHWRQAKKAVADLEVLKQAAADLPRVGE